MDQISFDQFPLHPFLLDAVKNMGFVKPTEIQSRVIPKALEGKSIIGQSQTGTGKTLAYLLPVLHRLNPSQRTVQAVILSPTRELARQIYETARELLGQDGGTISVRLFTGGMDKTKAGGMKNPPHVVIGTPGRIEELAKNGVLDIHTAEMLVIDEADMLMEMGFLETVDRIAARLPKDLQMFSFSATIPENLRPFLIKYMENPELIEVAPKQRTAENIEHWLVPVRHRDKISLLSEILRASNPFFAIVFANSQVRVEELAEGLSRKGLRVAVLHGDLSPRERKTTLREIREWKHQYLIATDLASRGLDIEGASHVIHDQLPRDLKYYIHRAGRTGRGDYRGVSIVLFEDGDEGRVAALEKRGIRFQMVDIENGQWRETGRKELRKKAGPGAGGFLLIKKPKQVKPGYKKKMRKEMERLRKRRTR
jgi:Helicase conserved C-terminal domain./DEAD/DEAH box helicase.